MPYRDHAVFYNRFCKLPKAAFYFCQNEYARRPACSRVRNGTLQAKSSGGWNANSNYVVRTSAVAVDVYNQTIDGEVAASLTAASGGSNTSGPKIMAAGFSYGQSANARSLGYELEKSPTLRGGEGGNQKPVVLAVDEK